ncbi:MAG: lantibiotic ABC transporter, partial [Bacteroidaceae bacterium]|nr:lantibiotic ABC transporter [Bacteroidaceae bacterium]
MKRILYILLSMTFAISASAQNQETVNVTGQVTSLSSASGGGVAPVSDVIVKLTLRGRTLAFGTTDTKGNYSLRMEELKEGTVLSFAHISYEAEEVVLKPDGQKKLVKDMVLVQKSISLKEVKVRANPLLLKGDTLSYNLASFLGKGDVTLEDGLKRLPGVEVAKSGAISYMGKGISAFNIEGLNMLGGKYNLATRNMGADMVTKVEVVRNYHARKMDEDKPSDAVALNIRLAKKAKFKPFGQEEAGAGWMQEGKDEWLGLLGLTGMMFTDKFQTICSVKAGNYKDYGASDMTYHFGGGGFST